MIRRPPRSPLFPYTPLFRPPPAERHPRLPPLLADLLRAGAARPTAHGSRDGRRERPLLRHRAADPATDRAGQDRLGARSEEHTSELQSRQYLVCRLLLEKKK